MTTPGKPQSVPSRDALATRFGHAESVSVARAPGRVNLIGEHTDYNQGFVLPTILDRHLEAAVCRRTGRAVRMLAADVDQVVTFELGDGLSDDWPRWAPYLFGLTEELRARGLLEGGFDLAISGTVPQAAGLASSAALETAVFLALTHAFGIEIDPATSIQLCHRVEHRWAGVRCGIMDQMASRLGRPDHALFIDCRSRAYRPVPLNLGEHMLVLVDSGVRRRLGDSAYNERRRECEEAVEHLRRFDPGLRSLRDVDSALMARRHTELPGAIAARCRHVVEENARVIEAEARLGRGDLAGFGKLMIASHESLRDLFAASHPVLDRLVAVALEVDGVLGARLTGAGFGGCTVSLCHASAGDELRRRMEAILAGLGLNGSVMIAGRGLEAGVLVS